MRKKFGIAAVLLAAFLSSGSPAAAGNDPDVVLNVWNKPTAADPLQNQVWEEEVKGFREFNPGIRINGIAREYKPQEFVSVMASGKGPDIVRIPITAIPLMAKYGFLAKLNGFTDKWTQKDYMPPIMWNSVNVDGGIYGIPYDSFFTTLFYNRKIFEKCGITKAPETWQDIIDDSKIISGRLKDTWGIALQPDMFNFMDFIWQAGGNFYDNGKLKLNDPAVIKALRFWHDLKWEYGAMPPQNILYEYDVEQLFATGKVAMMVGVANRLPVMARRYGLVISDIEIVPLPAGDSGIKGVARRRRRVHHKRGYHAGKTEICVGLHPVCAVAFEPAMEMEADEGTQHGDISRGFFLRDKPDQHARIRQGEGPAGFRAFRAYIYKMADDEGRFQPVCA